MTRPNPIRDHGDALIDWYERFNPSVRTVAVNCRPSTLKNFCNKNGVRGGPWLYRGREIVPMRKSEAERLAAAIKGGTAAVDEMQQYGTPGEDHIIPAAKLWDLRAVSIEPVLKQPKNLISTDTEHTLPKSQGDLLGEMRQ